MLYICRITNLHFMLLVHCKRTEVHVELDIMHA
jgi:hypothetical protein